MDEKVPKAELYFCCWLFFVVMMMWPLRGRAQTSLRAGDIAIVTVNADSPDNFDVVPLVDIEKGTTIHFTDNAYVAANHALKNNEGTITFTAPESVAAGTVLSYTGSDGNGFTKSGRFNTSGSGDNIICFQSNKSDTTFLYGVGWARGKTVWTYDPNRSPNTRSDIPPGLSAANHTLLSLGTKDNYQYDASAGTAGSRYAILKLIADNSHWKADDRQSFSAFSDSFQVLAPPIIRFATAADTTGEADGTYKIAVTLVEGNGKPVTANIVFLTNSSSASLNDIGNYATKTVQFSGSDSDGTVKTIPVTITNDTTFEGRETAVFKLTGISSGNIINPDIFNLFITDDDSPPVVINEFLADPPNNPSGDANGDGTENYDDDEFVEIVNHGSADINISGWQLSNDGGKNITYTFPAGTVLPAHQAAVVFGGGKPTGYFGGAIVQTTSSLRLTNTGGHVTLLNNRNMVVQDVVYGSEAANGQSMTRNPDITGSFVPHSEVSDAGGRIFSPGTKTDGTSFGARYAIAIRSKGWHMIATPTQNTTFEDLFGKIWTQGITGSSAPPEDRTIYAWDESGGGSFINKPTSMSDKLTPGKGYIVYVFNDDNIPRPGIQGGLPKIIHTDHKENRSPIRVSVTAHDSNNNGTIDNSEGFNLLGNPYGTDIFVDSVLTALRKVNPSVNANVEVWNASAGNGNGAYEVLTSGDKISPFQAFWIRYTKAGVQGDVRFDRSKLAANQGTQFYKKPVSRSYGFSIKLSDGHYFDTCQIKFTDDGAPGIDQHDAYKLLSLNPKSINLYSRIGSNRLTKNVLPRDLKSTVEIPLQFEAGDSRTDFQLKWGSLNSFPAGWKVYLTDQKLNKKVDMSIVDHYDFTRTNVTSKQTESSRYKAKINEAKAGNTDQKSRFMIAITPAAAQKTISQTQQVPSQVKLDPNYPNPFSSSTNISFTLKKKSHVRMTIWNIVGRKIATILDKTMDTGRQICRWNAQNMPSGIYICQLEVNGKTYLRKMTLIK